MRKAQITVTWNPERGDETKITFSPAWVRLSGLEKCDCLQDALGELDYQYQMAREQMDKEFDKIRKKAGKK